MASNGGNPQLVPLGLVSVWWVGDPTNCPEWYRRHTAPS